MAGRNQMQGPMDHDEYSRLRGQDLSQIAVEHPADPRKHRPAPPPPDVDWDFIKEREGMELQDYVPKDKKTELPLDNSGITIAAGFDLGQRNANDLKALNLTPELTARLTPYLGLKRADAQTFLAKNPLSVSDDEALAINKAVKADILNKTVKSYNAATARAYGAQTAPRLQDLPREAQTAIFSTAFQYGDLASRTPNYWKQITTGDWQGAHGNLMDFKDAYKTRRELEAGKLQAAIDSGRMPGAPPPRTPVR